MSNQGAHSYFGNIECPCCHKMFKTDETFKRHSCNICGKCGKRFTRKQNMIHHSCETSKTFECEKCKKQYASYNNLKKHKCSYCPLCGNIFSTFQKRNSHKCKPKQDKCDPSSFNVKRCGDKKPTCDLQSMDAKMLNEKEINLESIQSPDITSVEVVQTVQYFEPVKAQWQRQQCNVFNLFGHVTLDSQHIKQLINKPSVIKTIIGDGNCFFRCISYLITGTEENHLFFRNALVQHMKKNENHCRKLLDGNQSVEEYLVASKMDHETTWSTHIEIFAMAHMLKTDIYVYSCLEGSNIHQWLKHSAKFIDTRITPFSQNIYLNHKNRNHYEVVLLVESHMDSIPEGYEDDVLLFKEIQNQVQMSQKRKFDTAEKLSDKEKNCLRVAKWRKHYKNHIQENKRKRENVQNRQAEKMHKQDKRKCESFKQEENKRKRENTKNREAERKLKQEKRKYEEIKQEENKRKRENTKNREAEKTIKQVKRKNEEFKQEENKRKRENTKNREAEKTLKQEKRKYEEFKQEENKRKRENTKNREAEKTLKQERRKYEEFKQEENKRKRENTKNREAERTLKQEKRKSEEFKQEENKRKRENPKIREAQQKLIEKNRNSEDFRHEENKRKRENEKNRIKEKMLKQDKRKSEDFRAIENKRKHTVDQRYKEKEHKQLLRSGGAYRQSEYDKKKAQQKIDDIVLLIKNFHEIVQTGPCYVCSCCDQLWYRESVSEASDKHCLNLDLKSKVFTGVLSAGNKEWMCHTCLTYIKKNKLPPLAKMNIMQFPEKPQCLNLTQLEERLISPRIPFMQLRELPRGGQVSINGNVVNVPTNMNSTVLNLPRTQNDDACIPLQLKRRLSYQHHVQQEMIRPNRVIDALRYLVENSSLYKEEGVTLDENWTFDTDSYHDGIGKSRQSTVETTETINNTSKKTDETAEDKWNETSIEEQAVGNLDTMMHPLDITNDDSQVLAFAPCEGNTPINIFLDKYAEELSFPTIFCGEKRPSSTERLVPVNLSDIYKSELRQRDRRVASHIPNLFFKVKKLQAKHISSKANLCMRKAINTKGITAGYLKDSDNIEKICHLDEGYRVFKDLRGSPPYWEKTKKDLFAMIRCLGIPTWFASFSSAETRWTHLLKILAHTVDGRTLSDEEVSQMDWFQKCQLIRKDPVTCARHFQHQIQKFLTQVLLSLAEPVGKVKDYFYKVEFQMRGSPHIHMLMWVEDSPKLEENMENESEVLKYVDSYVTVSRDPNIEQLVKFQEHSHSRTCRKKNQDICRFSFPLPPLPETVLLTPLDSNIDSTSKQKHCDNWKKIGKTINNLKRGQAITFDEFMDKLHLSEEDYILAIRSSLSSNKIFLQREINETRINSYNKTLLQCWRANMDLQFVLDAYACAMYIVTYIAKSQRGISNLLYAATKEAREGNDTLRKQVKSIGHKFLTHVELSAQEAVYYILQMPLKKSSRQVVFINTSPQDERCVLLKSFNSIKNLSDDSEEVLAVSIHQRYAARPKALQNICLADFVSKYRIRYMQKRIDINDSEDCDDDEEDEDSTSFKCNGVIIKRRKIPACIRYVRYQEIDDQENYFREIILLFYPWKDESQLLGKSDTFTEQYRVLSKEFDIKTKMEEYNHRYPLLDQAIQDAENTSEDMLDEQWNSYAPTRAETKEDEDTGMGAEFCPELFPTNVSINDVELQTGELNACGTLTNYIKNDEYLGLVRSLNNQQEQFFLHILHHFKTSEEPIYYFLTGGAGVGKSVLVQVIYQAMARYFNSTPGMNPDEPKVLLAAPTGKAAHLIKGSTLHSLLKIPANQGFQYKPLVSEKLNTLRCKFKHVRLLIIDEISMVGNKMFSFIHQRLQQINGSNKLFGGLSVLAVGDLFQLKPVFDGWIFENLRKEYGPLALNLWIENFKMYELKDIMRQKDSKEFAELLNRLRECKHTPTDIRYLLQRKISSDLMHPDYPIMTPHIYMKNQDVDNHNQVVCEIHGSTYVKVRATDVVLGDVSTSVKTKILNSIPTDTSKTMGLPKELKTAIGLRNELSCNFDIEDGMTNGAAFILQKTGPVDKKNNIDYIWAQFEDKNVGKNTRTINKKLYTKHTNKMWTPIFKVKRQFPVGKYKSACVLRQQFPIRCAAAKTTHRCQGDTMKTAVVDFTGKTFPHSHYVALSRVTTPGQLFIRNLNETKIRVDDRVQREMERLRKDMITTGFNHLLTKPCAVSILYQNVSSLHQHIKDVQNSFIYRASDINIFVETKLKTRDPNEDFLIEGYHFHRFDFPASTRSTYGIAVYSRKIIPKSNFSYSTFHTSPGVIEMVTFQLQNTLPSLPEIITVHGIYISPKVKKEAVKTFITEQCYTRNLSPSLFIGDFNEDLLKKPSDDYISQTFSCQQLVTAPTTDKNALIDHVYVTEDLIQECTVHVLETYFSDHKPVLLHVGKNCQ